MMNKEIIKIASFNCKNVKRSIEGIRELCLCCDVIALQETWLLPQDIPYLSSIDNNFSYTGTSAVDTSVGMLRGRPYGGVALLWNKKVFQNVLVLQCDNPRICAIKIITSERPLIVISVYMPTDTKENLPEFTDCLGAMSALVNEYGVESTFILGDFNAHPNELFFYELLNFCNEQRWFCVDVDMLGYSSDTYTFVSEAHGSKRWLDHLVTTQAAKCAICNIYVKCDVWWSDHFPIVAECRLNVLTPKLVNQNIVHNEILWGERSNEQIDLYYAECNEKLKSIDISLELKMCVNCFSNRCSCKTTIDKLYDDIVNVLSDAAKKCKTYIKRRKPVIGWNDYVKAAHREARLNFQIWVLYGKPSSGYIYDKMSKSRKLFKSRLKWCQDHQDQIKMDRLAFLHSQKDFRGFWKNTNKLKVSPGLPVSVDGVTGSKDIANMFKDNFLVKSVTEVAPVHNVEPPNGNLATCITEEDVVRTIKSIAKGKSPGHDGLSIEHILYAGPHIAKVLSMFYSLCLNCSYLPSKLTKTVVVPVVKNKTGNLSDKNNYRPISLATIAAKVLDGILNTKLNQYVKIHDNQFGFRPGLSTESAILCLKQTIDYYTSRNTRVFAGFLDLSKAFDLVSYETLWKKLDEQKVPNNIVKILQFWYGSQVNVVKWSNMYSDPYKLECGVRQGGLTSPILFNLYVNDLIVALSSQHVGCHVDQVCVNNISYADDMVLLSASVCGLRKLLGICEKYAINHGLIYNVKKSEYMIFEKCGRNRDINPVPDIKLCGSILSRVYQFKYLGHIITTDLNDDCDIERERRALSVRANMIARRFARCSKEVKITLFRAYCTSFYASSLWASYKQKSYNALRVQYNNAFRLLMGLPRFCSASGMFAKARVDCFYGTMRKKCASLVRRVRASPNNVLNMIACRLDCKYVSYCLKLHMAVNNCI
ncbi:uncharacterized protein LOC123722186 [Papilio machaon]|uniref:uncharacterized protein LOC123722186 n=1 Tax=Papilio machaon TaxID=76193 RepID=UPI001E66495F|nr:uncharacterized protein LOC123722186 [Papilio machaon]